MTNDSQKLRDVFDQFDQDGDGAITTAELSGLLRALGQPSDPASVAAVMRSADADGEGSIDFSEFLTWAARQPLDEAELHAMFDSFDGNHDGYLSPDELRRAWSALGLPYTDATLQDADVDGDGLVTFDEFTRAVAASRSR